MKRTILLLISIALLVSMAAACGAGGGAGGPAAAATTQAAAAATTAAATTAAATTAAATTAEATTAAAPADGPITLRYATGQTEAMKVLNDIAVQINEIYPNVTMEITILPGGVAGYNAAMASKLAANDAPDIFTYQWGTQITAYARGGHLMDVTDIGVRELVKPFDVPSHVFKGREYAYPLVQSIWGLIYNTELAESMGVTGIPKTIDQFVSDMDTIREGGVQYPLIVPAKDGSGATGFIFCYFPQIVVSSNADYYYEVLTGDKTFNGPEWRGMFELYGKYLDYASPDSLGLDPDNAYTRFARGEGVYIQAGAAVINRIVDMNPDLDGKLLYIPYPVYETEEQYATIANFDHATSIWSKTKYPEQAIELYKLFFTPENGAPYAASLNIVSAVRGTPDTSLDPSIVNMFPLLEEGKYTGFFARDWVPGLKEIMKTHVQEWMAGTVDVDGAMDGLDADHQRMLEANPDFIDDYMDIRELTTGS